MAGEAQQGAEQQAVGFCGQECSCMQYADAFAYGFKGKGTCSQVLVA